MKPHERDLLLAFDAAKRADPHLYGRPWFTAYPMPINRVCYLLEKWCGKDWYDYGVNILCGWLTPEGKAMAARLRFPAPSPRATETEEGDGK